MSDAQLLSYFNRLEKILNETKIYTKLMAINKEGLAPNYYDEDELLFPLEIGHEMYNKTLKVYMESKAYIDGIEKSLNKCIDKIGKNEKASNLINSQKFNSNNNNNNLSSSSSDEESSKNDQVGQKRKSKNKITPGSAKMNKRPKQPSHSDKEDTGSNSTTTSTSTSSSTPSSSKDKGSDKEKSEKNNERGDKLDKSSEKESNGNTSSKSTTPNKESNHNNNSTNSSNSNGNGNSSNTSSGSNNGNGPFNSIQSGQLVAARDKNNQWILAKVNSFNSKTQKCEVIDEDEEEPKRFSVGQKDLIQLPSLSNLPPAFAIGKNVLSLFPQTTVFYPAVVVNVQKVKGKPVSYQLHFEDDQDDNGETPSRRVNAQYVISLNN